MTADGPIIPQQRFDGDGEVAIARLTAVRAPARPAEPDEPTLFISESFIDVGEVWAGEVLPIERVTVTASTEADWVRVATDGALLLITVTPREGASRANVLVRNEVTGETRTVRVAARLRAPAPAAPVSTPDLFDALFTQRQPADAAPTIPASPPPKPAQGPSPDLRQQVHAAFNRAWPPARLATAVREVVATYQLGPDLPSPWVGRVNLRQIAGLPPHESLLGFAHPGTGTEWVMFTDRAVYWVQKGATVVVPYPEFTLRNFRAIAPTRGGPVTHVDFGDGVPRLAGSTAQQVYAVLTALQERFRAS